MADTTPDKDKAAMPMGATRKKPNVSHEGSRTQFMCRTGRAGGDGDGPQNFAIKYGKNAGEKEKAHKQAKTWLAAELKDSGFA